MVDINPNGKRQGLTYLLVDYAKSVNGGKDLKINSKKWVTIMKVVEEINNKRSHDNKIYTGGSNLFGKTNENFILTNNTIHFSEAEIALILKEMGVETQEKKEDLFQEKGFEIKGLSVERSTSSNQQVYNRNDYSIHPDFADISPDELVEQAPKTIDTQESKPTTTNNNNDNNIIKPDENSKSFLSQFKADAYEKMYQSDLLTSLIQPTTTKEVSPNIYTLSNGEPIELNPLANNVTVTSANDTINLAPPYKIKTPTLGKRGGGTRTISEQFHRRAMEIADSIGCKYEDLITVMNFESGIDTTSGKENPRKRPVGLIQFTGTAIKALNKTYGYNLDKDKILQMNEIEQLDIVEKYFEMTKRDSSHLKNKKTLDAADLYTLTILPGRAGKDVLCQKGETDKHGRLLRYYESNKGIDVGKDGIISRSDILAKLDEFRIHVQVV
ncbi:hypothetical protein IKU74_07500 [bacterium]|nr:hypothetical protein [bacterium]